MSEGAASGSGRSMMVGVSISLSLGVGGILAWVLVDPQRWFGDEFVARTTAIDKWRNKLGRQELAAHAATG